MSKIEEIKEALISWDTSDLVPDLVQEAIDEGYAPLDILSFGLINAMAIVGERFSNNEIFIPEMICAADAMKEGIEILEPHLANGETTTNGKVVVGTVKGDLHDIGKNLVAIMIESAGFEVIDLGVDVPADKFVESASDPEVVIIGISTLLTTTMPAMREIVDALNAHERRADFKIMVGGAPVTQTFANEIGADIFTNDAAAAAQAAKQIAASLRGNIL